MLAVDGCNIDVCHVREYDVMMGEGTQNLSTK